MKKFYYLLMAVLFSLVLFLNESEAQLSGTITIPGTNYPTIKVAVDSLNTYGVGTGGVIFNVSAGYTESITDPIILKATGTSANPIIFQKSGVGANPLITRTDTGTYATSVSGGQGDAVIIIQGSDYVTFDAIDVSASNQRIEYGYYFRKKSPTDGCKNVTVKYCAVTMTKGTSGYVTGIYSSNNDSNSLVSSSNGITVTSIDGRSENVKIIGNTVQNVHTGIQLRGYNHTIAPYNFQDTNFIVGQTTAGNIIQNFGGGSTAITYGIYLSYHKSPNLSYNVINNTAGGGVNASGTLYGIYLTSSSSGDCIYNDNYIKLEQGSTSAASCIHDATTGTSKTINNNTFGYGTFASSTTSYIIYASSSTNNVIVSGNQVNGLINCTGTSGNFYFYYNIAGSQTGGTETITNNIFDSVTFISAAYIYGIYSSVSSSMNRICSGNTISNISTATGIGPLMYLYGSSINQIFNNNIHSISQHQPFYGIQFTGTNTYVYDNEIYDLITNGGVNLFCIYNNGATTTYCYNNKIYNLTIINNSYPNLHAVYISSGTNYVYNNFISDLKTPTANTDNAFTGIFVAGGTFAGLYYNTIYLNSSSSGTNFGSSGIFGNTTPVVDMRNNIIVNTSIPNGTGRSVAYRRSSSTLTTYSSVSNNNCFYAGTPGANRLIFYDGTNSDQTIASYQARVSPRDNASFSENPPFVNFLTPPYNLHIQNTIPTFCGHGGTVVSSPISITDDFDGNTRNSLTPDVGADEFSVSGPVITYTPLSNTSGTINRAFNNVTAYDSAGINFNSGTAPRVYYKKSSDANTWIDGNSNAQNSWKYVETTTGSSPFDFTLDYSKLYGSGSVSLGDTIQYFVVAQNLSLPPFVGINRGGFNTLPSSVVLTSSAFPITGTINRYVIIQGYSDTILVGTGQTYTTLTGTNGLFDAINKGLVTGNLTICITSYLWEPGTVALNETSEELNYNIRIVPDTATERTIAGSYNGGLIRLNGADRITIDGSYNGSGQYLKFRNRYPTSLNSYTINLLNNASYDTIKNCIIQGASTPVYFGAGTSGSGNLNNVFDNVEVMDADSANMKALYGFNLSGAMTVGTKILNSKIHNVVNHGIFIYNISDSNITVKNCDIFRYGSSGIYLQMWGGSNNLIEGNRIYQDTANFSGSINYGVWIESSAANSSLIIRNNNIYNLAGISTATLKGIYYYGSSITMSVYIYNNVISIGGSTVTTGQIDGIDYYGYAQNNCYIYHNSIYIGGANVTGTSNTNGIYKSDAVNIFSVYDNAVYNARSNSTGTGKHYAYSFYNTSATNWLQNYNVIYVSGTGGVLTRYGGTDYNTFLGWQTVSKKDTNSINSNPLYVNYSTLIPGIDGSPLLAAGTPISSITKDILDSNRSTTNPTIGAYENGIEGYGPFISYTLLTHGSSLTGRTFTAAISDYSGVDTAAGTRPRVYYKKITDANTFIDNTNLTNGWKWTEATNNSTPFSFTIDYSLIFGGSVSYNDTVQYFVTAQDLLGPYVSINSGTFASTPASVNLTSSAFPVTGTINKYKLLPGYSGTVTVGTGQTYPTLTGSNGLFAAINAGLVSSDMTAYITSDIWEPGTVALNQTLEELNYNIRIVPDSAVLRTLAGSYAGGLIRLNGADRITIDGSYNGSGQYLRFRNRSSSSSAYTINLLNDASNDTIKNCIVQGVYYPVYFGNGTSALGNLYNVFDNVEVRDADSANLRPSHGIYIYGTYTKYTKILNSKIHNVSTSAITNYGAAGYTDSNLTVRNCDIYRFGNYGIYLNYWSGSDNLIEGNRIYQDTANYSGSVVYGIYVYLGAVNSNVTIRNNKIYNLAGSASAALKGIYCTGSTTAINVLIYNNAISVGDSTVTTGQVDGVDYNGNAANNFYVYYNSIYIKGANVTAGSSYGINKRNAAGNFAAVNNSVYNARSNGTGTGKHYAYSYSNTATTNWQQNYNNLYITGTGGVLTNYTGTDLNTLSDWLTNSGKDTNSISGDPLYNYSVNSDLQPQAGSPLDNAGTPISGITTDIIDSIRNITTPTIGAYETILPDLQGPNIVYSNLLNTLSTSNRVLTNFAAITDPGSGVDTASGTRPRIYYKKSTDNNAYNGNTSTDNGWKWKEAGDNASPFDFIIDYSIINGGSVTTGDTIHYFIAAQDIMPTPNVGIKSGTFASQPSSVNLTSSAFPIGGTINQYIISVAYAGTVNVGTGQTYTTLTGTDGLFDAINKGVVSGNIFANITSDITEPGTVALNETTEELMYTIRIQPSDTVMKTLTGNYTGGLIRLNGADRITIDGNYNGSGKYLTIENTSTSSLTAAIMLISSGAGQGCVNDTIKNCYIKAGTAGTGSAYTYGIHIGGSVLSSIPGGGPDNNYDVIANNSISRSYCGIGASGTSVSSLIGLRITGNEIGSVSSSEYNSKYGMYLQYCDTALVNKNRVFNQVVTSIVPEGIHIGTGFKNSGISQNEINSVRYAGTGGSGGRGIYVNTAVSASNLSIYNNIMYGISGTGSTYGILIEGTNSSTITGGLKLYYNSVNMYGNLTFNAATVTAAINFSTAYISDVDLRNNIFVNSMVNTASTSGRSYTVYSSAASTAFTNIDYNNYYATGTQSYLGYLGSARSTLAQWQTATGKDKNSLSGDPGFTSAVNLLPDAANENCWNENGKGIQIPLINNDFNNSPRSTFVINGPTDIGAYEFTPAVTPPAMVQTGTIGVGNTTSYAQSQKTYLDITWGASLNNKRENNRESVNNVRTNTGNTRTSTSRSGDYPATVTVKKYSGVTPPDTAGLPSPQMSKGYWYVDADADPGSPVTVKVYWGDEELGNITDTGKLILAMYDMKSRVWLPFYRGTGSGYSVVDPTNKTITVSGLTRLDSVCYALTSSDYPLKRFALDLTLLIEGLYYDGGNPPNMVPDTVKAELRTPVTFSLIETMTIPLDLYGKGFGYTASALAIPDSLFWLVIKHRNALETWCDTVNVKPVFSRITGISSYDFTSAQSQAYGSNMVLKNGKWCIYSGDIVKDGLTDAFDMVALDNDLYNYISGWVVTDLNGDMIVDGADMAILDVNLYNFIGVIKPFSAPGYMKNILNPKREHKKTKIDNNIIKKHK